MYCRNCGGKTSLGIGGETTCANVEPKLECENLRIQDRRFCEHCGAPEPGPGRCPKCGLRPNVP